jgi:GNAT superfamily N-acetyltransferase
VAGATLVLHSRSRAALTACGQISPGDRRLLAEFALGLTRAAPERELAVLQEMNGLLFDRVIASGREDAGRLRRAGEHRRGRPDHRRGRVRPDGKEGAEFRVAVAGGYRDEQVGRTLLATLVRHARRAGIPRLSAEMFWSNRAMQLLAMSMGFVVEPVSRDRNLRRLVLALK